jgi:AraC-like DNA-binding protein
MARAQQSLATTSIRLVWPFLSLATKHGRDVSRIVARLGLTGTELLDPDTRVPTRVLAELLREAIERTGERDIGLLAARWVDAAHFGVGEYLARVRPTLGAVMQDTARYLPLLSQGLEYSIKHRGEKVIVRLWFRPELMMHPAVYEFAVAIAVLRARRVTRNNALRPLAIHFPHAKPASTARHEAIFGCRLVFSAKVTQVVLLARSLELALPGAEAPLAGLLARHAEHMLERLTSDQDLTSRVLGLVGGEVDLREVTVEHIAQRVGMSVRNLSRRLAEEGTSYRAVLDRVRKQVAISELTDGSLDIEAIADKLGFASSQSFHRAFRRWTGTTADSYRRSVARGDVAEPARKPGPTSSADVPQSRRARGDTAKVRSR